MKGQGKIPRLLAYGEFHCLAERQFDVELAMQSASYTPSPQHLPNSSSTQAKPPAASNSRFTLSCSSGVAVKLCLTLKMQFQALCPLGNTHKCSSEVQTAKTVWKNKKSPTIPSTHMISGGITERQISRAKMNSAEHQSENSLLSILTLSIFA